MGDNMENERKSFLDRFMQDLEQLKDVPESVYAKDFQEWVNSCEKTYKNDDLPKK